MYTIKSTNEPIIIGGYEFNENEVDITTIPILNQSYYSDLFNAVMNEELVILKDGVEIINGTPVMSSLISLHEGVDGTRLGDGGVLYNQWVSVIDQKEEVVFNNTTLTLGSQDSRKEYDIQCENDYSIVLPSLGDVSYSDLFRFKNVHNSFVEGSIVPVIGETIEGDDGFKLFGKGFLTIKKKKNSYTGNDYWLIVECSNIKNTLGEGQTKRKHFNNETVIEEIHNLGYIPETQVWIEDGQGGYTDADVDVDHDFIEKDKFEINFTEPNTGFVLYV